MSDTIAIHPTGPLRGPIRPPGSKSITNRALICAALAQGESTLTNVLASDDTHAMIAALRLIGIDIAYWPEHARIVMDGCGGRLPSRDNVIHIDVENSGTTARFLTAMLPLGKGTYRLNGTPRMCQRPIGDLLNALRQLGADAVSEAGTGCPPLVVRASGLTGGRTTIAGDISSQFLSGLLMAAPYAHNNVEIAVLGDLVSKPYVEMTLSVMTSFGVDVIREGLQRFTIVVPQYYSALEYPIEPDASAASYFLAAAAITRGEITVEGLSRYSLQGDVTFCDCLQKMGCEVRYGPDSITVIGRPLHGIDVDMNSISDTVQTLGAVALFAEGPTAIRNVAHIRHKETDRIAALATELRKLGAGVGERPDGLTITPGALHGAEIDTYDDHRMAMSLALVGLATPGVVIRDPGCTAKTYPDYFHDLDRLAR